MAYRSRVALLLALPLVLAACQRQQPVLRANNTQPSFSYTVEKSQPVGGHKVTLSGSGTQALNNGSLYPTLDVEIESMPKATFTIATLDGDSSAESSPFQTSGEISAKFQPTPGNHKYPIQAELREVAIQDVQITIDDVSFIQEDPSMPHRVWLGKQPRAKSNVKGVQVSLGSHEQSGNALPIILTFEPKQIIPGAPDSPVLLGPVTSPQGKLNYDARSGGDYRSAQLYIRSVELKSQASQQLILRIRLYKHLKKHPFTFQIEATPAKNG